MKNIDWDAIPTAGDLYGEMELASQPPTAARLRMAKLLPGLLLCAAASGAAAWLAGQYGFPVILLGLLVGLALNTLAHDTKTHAGLDFASRMFLRAGIVLLGFQMTFAQFGALGVAPFAALAAIMALSFAGGLLGARIAGQSRYAGILAGGATAICGASAALALYGVIGRDRLSQAQFALTLVVVSLASALTLTTYPAITGILGLNDAQAGFLIGASIHDAAQAIGGGFAVSDAAGAQATIVKLTRVALLGPVVLLVSLWIGGASLRKGGVGRRLALPGFLILFAIAVTLNSVVTFPPAIGDSALAGSKAMLLLAVTATALRSRLSLIRELGWRAAMPVVVASVASFLAALAAVQIIN